MKRVYDLRGGGLRLLRLGRFNKEALVHMLAFRLMIFVAIAYGVVLLGSLAFPGLGEYVKPLTIASWILFIPLVFALIRGFSLTGSGGMAFGRFSATYTTLKTKKSNPTLTKIYRAIPYLCTLLWVLCFFAMLEWWP